MIRRHLSLNEYLYILFSVYSKLTYGKFINIAMCESKVGAYAYARILLMCDSTDDVRLGPPCVWRDDERDLEGLVRVVLGSDER